METPKAHRKYRIQRPTFEQVRESERAKYEALMKELADEVNALKAQLDAERAALAEIRGSWLATLRYKFRGEV